MRKEIIMRKFITVLAAALLLTGCAAGGGSSVTEESGASAQQTESAASTAAGAESVPEAASAEAETEKAKTTEAETEKAKTTEAETAEAKTAEAETAETEKAPADCPVRADYAEDVAESYPERYEFAADDGENTLVMFTTDSRVTDFKVLFLTCENIDDNGSITFSTEELYTADELTPERPALVGMTFIGLIPNNGISFVDANGVERRFAVDMSGKDGSLFMWEF